VLGVFVHKPEPGAHFCTNDAQTFDTLKNYNIQCGGATVSMTPPLPLCFLDSAGSFCSQTSGPGANFCTNDAQTFGTIKISIFQKGGVSFQWLPHFVFLMELGVFVHKRLDLVQISAQTMHKRLAWSIVKFESGRGALKWIL